MRTLPKQLRLELGPYRVLLCHGSPRKTNEFLWESTTPTHFLDKLAERHQADVLLATHTGIRWRRELSGNVAVRQRGRAGPARERRPHERLVHAAGLLAGGRHAGRIRPGRIRPSPARPRDAGGTVAARSFKRPFSPAGGPPAWRSYPAKRPPRQILNRPSRVSVARNLFRVPCESTCKIRMRQKQAWTERTEQVPCYGPWRGCFQQTCQAPGAYPLFYSRSKASGCSHSGSRMRMETLPASRSSSNWPTTSARQPWASEGGWPSFDSYSPS